MIPERILTRAPSAELRPNQTDQDALPPYDVLDRILKVSGQAVTTFDYGDISPTLSYIVDLPLGGQVQPMRGSDSIMWTIKFRNGVLKRFKFPIRTTPEGSIDPFGGKPVPKLADIEAVGSFTRDTTGGYRAGNPAELIRK